MMLLKLNQKKTNCQCKTFSGSTTSCEKFNREYTQKKSYFYVKQKKNNVFQYKSSNGVLKKADKKNIIYLLTKKTRKFMRNLVDVIY